MLYLWKENNLKVLLIFTFEYSLKTWKESGSLERELSYYNKLAEKFNIKFLFLTYGNENEKNYLVDYPNIDVIPMYKYIKAVNNKYLLFFKTLIVPFLIRKKISDINIIKTNQLNGSWVGIVLRLITRKPLFIRTGYDAFLFSVKEKKPLIKRALFYLLTQLSLIFSKLYTVSSFDDYEFISKYYLFNKSKLQIRQNWINENNKIKFENRNNYKIISIGRLASQKNYDYLISEFSNSEYSIDLVGTGPDEEFLSEKSKKFNTNVNFLGNIEYEKLMEMLNDYKYFVSTSLFEGNPKVILEAMAAGCVVFAVDIPNNSEIIKHKHNGLLYKPGERNLFSIFQRISNNKDFSKLISENAVNDSRSIFSVSKLIEKEYEDYLILSK